MRYNEFQSEIGICEQMVALASHYAAILNPELLENNEKQIYNTFINNVKSNLPLVPIINKQYCPIGLTAMSIPKIVVIKKVEETISFVKYQPKTKQYQFKDSKGKIYLFPAASKETHKLGDSHQLDTLLFQNLNDADQFLSIFLLTFSNWHIRYFK